MEPEVQRPKFNTTVDIRDPKSGRVIARNPYRLIISQKEGGGKEEHFERPVGSGIFHWSNGEVDMEKSKAGLEAKAKTEADKNKTEFEKAKDKVAQATSELKLAEANYKAEQDAKARKLETPKVDERK